MTREEFESILEEAYIEGYNTAIEDIQEDILDEEAYDLENEYEVYAEGYNKKYYAIVSSKMWSSIFLSGVLSIGTLMIPLGAIARSSSATAHESLEKAIYNWIKYNSMRGFKVDEKKKIIYVDKKWYDKEKDTDVIVLTAPERSVFKGVFTDKTIQQPYMRHGGVISGGDSFDYKFFKDRIEELMKKSGITSTEMSFEHACKKAGIKVKFEDFSINPLNAINIWKKANGLGESYSIR